MSGPRIFTNLLPKEQAIYEAVIKLLEEGAAVNQMKVSDIARQAGMGKGTVYEYFGSKEEIIGKALLFDVENTLEEIKGRVMEVEQFWERVRIIFDWIDEKYRNHSSFFRILQVGRSINNIPQPIQLVIEQHKECTADMYAGVGELIKSGIAEGVVSKQIPQPYLISAMVANLFTYCIYLSQPVLKATDLTGEIDYHEMKEFVLNCIRKALTD